MLNIDPQGATPHAEVHQDISVAKGGASMHKQTAAKIEINNNHEDEGAEIDASKKTSIERVGVDVANEDPLSHYNTNVDNYNEPCCMIKKKRLRRVFTCWFVYPWFYNLIAGPFRLLDKFIYKETVTDENGNEKEEYNTVGLICAVVIAILIYCALCYLYTYSIIGIILLVINFIMALIFIGGIVVKIMNSCDVPDMLARCIYAPKLLKGTGYCNDFIIYTREEFAKFTQQSDSVKLILEHSKSTHILFMIYSDAYRSKNCKWLLVGFLIHFFHCAFNTFCIANNVKPPF